MEGSDMKAILTYGIFTATVSMNEPMRRVTIMKPKVLEMFDPTINPADVLEQTKLIFELKESPKVGVPLKYEFVGEA